MPITVEQLGRSQRGAFGNAARSERGYIAKGSNVMADIKAAVLAVAPSTFNSLPIDAANGVNVEETEDENLWFVTVSYSKAETAPEPPETGDSEFEFDTSGGSVHITQALATIDSGIPSGFATTPDFSGAINVSDGGVEGTDIVAPQYVWSETHYIDDGDVDGTFKANLFALTGKTNNASFKGFAAGETLFLGARGSKRGSGDWAITFSFSSSPNVTGLSIAGCTVDKDGWEYLWVLYEDMEDTTAKRLVRRPRAVYVVQVYESGDFSLLGIGT